MTASPRKPWSAFLLSILTTGVGQIYAGYPLRGMLILLAKYVPYVAIGLAGGLSTLSGFIAATVITASIHIIALVDAVLLARKGRTYTLRAFNRGYVYLLAAMMAIAMLCTLTVYRIPLFGFGHYRISSNAMAPTLSADDQILVDTRATSAHIGDIIIFRPPQHPDTLYSMRVAATGGDRLAIQNGDVLVNGVAQPALTVTADQRQLPQSVTFPELEIPPGQLFVLGDYRDNSNDSRYWGFVPEENVVGTVTAIFYSADLHKIGTLKQ
ncbi:signal peptidase I [Pokkaliibacter plantistimulans]|nr:signal peptidase I [Pokkaliibacter plantistimulans]